MPVSKRTIVKPLIVGEHNPYGSDPHFALYPAPDGCSGHRLCRLILGMRRTDYLRAFERVNLCSGVWKDSEATQCAYELSWRCIRTNCKLVLCGAKVCSAFDVEFRPFERLGTHVLVLPHPSGANRMWNDVGAFQRARDAAAAFLPEIADLIGAADGGTDE